MYRRTIIITDIDHTISVKGENDEQIYSDEEMIKFLDLIANYERVSGTKVSMHLLSMSPYEYIKKFVDRMEATIKIYNNRFGAGLNYIEGAVALPTLDPSIRSLDKTIYIQNYPKNEAEFKTWKYPYISLMKDKLFGKSRKYENVIFMGDSSNDLAAMQLIHANKGTVITPKIKEEKDKNLILRLSDYHSDKPDLKGVIEAFENYTEDIKRRLEENDIRKNEVDDNCR